MDKKQQTTLRKIMSGKNPTCPSGKPFVGQEMADYLSEIIREQAKRIKELEKPADKMETVYILVNKETGELVRYGNEYEPVIVQDETIAKSTVDVAHDEKLIKAKLIWEIPIREHRPACWS